MQFTNELEQNLIEQKKLYELAADIETKKGEAIAQRSLQDLEAVIQKEESLLKEIEKLEDERLYIVWKCCGENGLAARASLSEIAESLSDTAAAERLLETGRSLKKAVSKVKLIKETNEKLMNENLELFGGLLNGLKNITGIKTGYDKEGRESNKVVGPFLFNTTA